MRVAKWALIVVGGLLVLLAGAVFVMTSVVDPNRYRGKVAAIVSDLAGRPFVIDGKLAVTWYPWLGVRTEQAHLDELPGHPGPPLIEWQSVAVAVKVLPLLHGQLVVDRIQLQSPRVSLRRDAQGHGNWEGLGGSSSAPQPRSRSNTQTQIAGLDVRDATIDYVDEASGLRINLSKVDFEMGEWRAGQSLPVHVRALIHHESLPPNGVWAELDTPALGVTTQPLNVTAPKLKIKVADAAISGSITYNQTAAGLIDARGSIAAQVPSLRKLAADLALNQTMPHDPTTLGPLELTTQWSFSEGVLAAKPLALKLDGINFEGWLERGAAPRPGWRFELHGDRIDLGRYVNVDSTSQKPFELQMLKDINADGSLVFDEALLADARLSGVRLQVQTAGVER